MDIGSKCGYPASALSNFAPHKFIFDGVLCNSAEGPIQSFKQKNHAVQIEMCKLVGYAAKKRGKFLNWQDRQILYWKGKGYLRESKEYQELLDKLYDSLATSDSFRRALLATGDAVLTHSIGRDKERETVLTKKEFCSRLMKLRERMKRGEI